MTPLPVLHGSADGPFLTAWVFDPLLVLPLFALTAAYCYGLSEARRRGRRPVSTWRVAAFFGGLVAVAVALLGPLDVWNDELLFLHMIQHLALMLVAAPLLLLGRPVQVALQALPPSYSRAVIGGLFRHGRVRRLSDRLTHPGSVFLIANGSVVLWHWPPLYEWALVNELVHAIEHAAFFGGALLFWWVIIDPVPRHHRALSHWQFGLCFGSAMFGGLVAFALTVANRVLYPYYLVAEQPWGLTPLVDQKIGGGVMWVSGTVYFTLMFLMLYRMVNPGDTIPARPPVAAAPTLSDDRLRA